MKRKADRVQWKAMQNQNEAQRTRCVVKRVISIHRMPMGSQILLVEALGL